MRKGVYSSEILPSTYLPLAHQLRSSSDVPHGMQGSPFNLYAGSTPLHGNTTSNFPASGSTPSFSLMSRPVSFSYFQPTRQILTEAESEGNGTDTGQASDESSGISAPRDLHGRRRFGACTYCKSLKVKCHYPQGQSVCLRCHLGHHECVRHVRKKRKPVPTQDELQERADQQDRLIAALIREIDKRKSVRRTQEWLAKAQPSGSTSNAGSSNIDRRGMASAAQNWPGQYTTYDFARSVDAALRGTHADNTPSVLHGGNNGVNQRQFLFNEDQPFLSAPDIVTSGLIQPSEVHELFKMFFDLVNPYFSMLDPDLHTPTETIRRSYFLFTVICALASRFYTLRPKLCDSAMEFARDAAGKALVEGSKNIEACQAFILLAVFPMPKKKWLDDRSWLFMGIAFRLAMELELSSPCHSRVDEREDLNRVRTWLVCFCVDSCHAVQYGKPAVFSINDFVARTSQNWYTSSRFNLPTDVHLIAHVAIIRVMGRFQVETSVEPGDTVRSLSDVAERYSIELCQHCHDWTSRMAELPLADTPVCLYRADCFRLIIAYLRLVIYSRAFQKTVAGRLSRDDRIVHQCVSAAQEVIRTMVERLFPTGMLRYSREAYFVFVTFAASFLLNLLTPKFSSLLPEGQDMDIEALIRTLINVLQSRATALDNHHSPYLHARFLQGLLDKHARYPHNVSITAAQRAEPIQVDGIDGLYQGHQCVRNDNNSNSQTVAEDEGLACFEGGPQENFEAPNEDFSLSNFLQTISSEPDLQSSLPEFRTPDGEHEWWADVQLSLEDFIFEGFQWPVMEVEQEHMDTQQDTGSMFHF